MHLIKSFEAALLAKSWLFLKNSIIYQWLRLQKDFVILFDEPNKNLFEKKQIVRYSSNCPFWNKVEIYFSVNYKRFAFIFRAIISCELMGWKPLIVFKEQNKFHNNLYFYWQEFLSVFKGRFVSFDQSVMDYWI